MSIKNSINYWQNANLDKCKELFRQNSKIKEYNKGKLICETGDDRVALRFFSSGFAVAENILHKEKIKLLAAPIFKGTYVGVADLVRNTSTVNIIAEVNCLVYEMDLTSIQELIDIPEFLRFCMWISTSNVLLLTEYAAAARATSAEERLVAFLKVAFLHQNGVRPKGSFAVEWPASQALLAGFIHVRRPYLNEHIRRLTKSGKLKIEGKKFFVTV